MTVNNIGLIIFVYLMFMFLLIGYFQYYC